MIIASDAQNDDAWMAARLSIPTGSQASRLITSKGEPSSSVPKYAKELAIELLTGQSVGFGGNAHTEYGHEHEQAAVDWYAFERDCDPQEIGFCLHDSGAIGASPDRKLEGGVVEVKCKPLGHLDALLYWKKYGKLESAHLPQVHCEMLVTDSAWADVVYFHPSPYIPNLIIRVERDAKMDGALLVQAEACIVERDRIVSEIRSIGSDVSEAA